MSKNNIFVFMLALGLYSCVNCFAQNETVSVPAVVPTQENAAENKFVYDAQGKRNPFIALVTSDGRLLKISDEQQSGGLTLEGIIYDEQGISFAMVNGSVVKVGDTISGYQVLKIESSRVIFIKDGEPFMAELKKEE
ncbi:MAG: hypothetical protein C4540_05310 [Candidatus Omnitrophota bacterium]|jgi:type II secretory pathway component PulC|nr:MAG: hypothetical protein C4540_05310 [Candidatus Omnitrophota bacterium]